MESPALAAPDFSPGRGYFEDPFELELSSSTPDALIRYTLDTRTDADQWDPYLAPIRVASTAVMCRRLQRRVGTFQDQTHTYLFAEHMAAQPATAPAIRRVD
jgi:hypothetical protein